MDTMPNPEAMAGTAMLIMFLVIGFIGLIMLAVYIFYLLTLQKCLKRVSEKNRQMSPGLVWLNLIPLFVFVWQFFTVIKIANSLKAEFAEKNITGGGDCGYTLGLIMCILNCIAPCASIIPLIGILPGLGLLVIWIIYWIKIAGYSKRLAG